MTIDKEKLRALAEAATQNHGARRVEFDHNGVHVIGDGSWKILSAWRTPDGKGAHNAEFAAAASPVTVLALLAEIESTETRLHDVAVLCATVEQERDQLKAENEDYKSGQERYEQIIEDLKAENEALRKDAERYRWLRKPWQEQRQVKAWTSLEVMDENIDAAMAKEANHDR